MKNLKRNLVIATVLLFVVAAVYLNWSYNNNWGDADSDMVDALDSALIDADSTDSDIEEASFEDQDSATVSDYFASARLTRQQSREEALELLQMAATAEFASQETIDSAMNEIAAMASFSMTESQLENLLLAKDFAECVVFMSSTEVTIAVPSGEEGLTDADVAKITDTITSETDFEATQLRIIEVKD